MHTLRQLTSTYDHFAHARRVGGPDVIRNPNPAQSFFLRFAAHVCSFPSLVSPISPALPSLVCDVRVWVISFPVSFPFVRTSLCHPWELYFDLRADRCCDGRVIAGPAASDFSMYGCRRLRLGFLWFSYFPAVGSSVSRPESRPPAVRRSAISSWMAFVFRRHHLILVQS